MTESNNDHEKLVKDARQEIIEFANLDDFRASWDLPERVSEQCDRHFLRKWTWEQTVNEFQFTDSGLVIERYSFLFQPVWVGPKPKQFSEITDPTVFWLSFRAGKLPGMEHPEAYVLISPVRYPIQNRAPF